MRYCPKCKTQKDRKEIFELNTDILNERRKQGQPVPASDKMVETPWDILDEFPEPALDPCAKLIHVNANGVTAPSGVNLSMPQHL